MGVWGAIANNMEASQETCFPYNYFGAKITQACLQIIKRYVPKFFMKAYVEKFERNYIDIWGSGAIAPEASDISKNLIKWKPDIYFFNFLAVLPKSPKVCACSPAPLE